MEQVDQDSSVMKHPGCSSDWMDVLSELFQVVLCLSSWVLALGRLLARPCVVKQSPGRFSTNVEPEGHTPRQNCTCSKRFCLRTAINTAVVFPFHAQTLLSSPRIPVLGCSFRVPLASAGFPYAGISHWQQGHP